MPRNLLNDVEQLPTIATRRLRLRWLTRDDVPALFEVFSDPIVCRYWSRPPQQNVQEAAALLQEIEGYFAARTLFQWGIAEAATNQIIGTCTLANLSREHHRAEIGFALARHAWGHGYAAEAVNALLTFAFDTLRLHRVEADVDPRNHRSIAVLERAGFRREGYLRQRYHLMNEVQDALFYGLLRNEFVRAIVRPAHADELEQVARVWHDAWQDAHAHILPAELVRMRTLASFAERLRAALPSVRVADVAGQPVGFYMIKADELNQLFVAAEARGSGVAVALLSDAESRLRANGVKTAWLACAIGNHRAASFYEKCGWRRTGTFIHRAEISNGALPVETWRYEKQL